MGKRRRSPSSGSIGGNRSAKDGLTSYCKQCHAIVARENKAKNHGSERNYLIRYRYGITEDDFERMLARQGGLCAICRAVPGAFVDHCHRTGRVRGVLCFQLQQRAGPFRRQRGTAGAGRVVSRR
ncbi:endonuclease domain-containing protein [Nonomuraea maritima]|uniref:endonuclease domain-containing protein n=1 Tax=Nonomuraea maritima TaxID=683260 RepID=UPI00372020CB